MIIETENAVIVDENTDLAAEVMGGIWLDFKRSIPEPQARILTAGFNFILLCSPGSSSGSSAEDEEGVLESDGYDTLVVNVITEILVDDTIHTAEKKNAVYLQIVSNIIDALTKLGFTLDEDVAGNETIQEMLNLGNLFFDLDHYDDVIGLADLLDSKDIPPKERLLLLLERYLGEDLDQSVYECLVVDISEMSLTVLRTALLKEDATEGLSESLVERIVTNRAVLEGTLIFDHIRNNGQLGGSVESFLNFYSRELKLLLDNPTRDNMVQYGREVTAMYLGSEMNTPVIRDSLLKYLAEIITDYEASIKVESFIKKLVLKDD